MIQKGERVRAEQEILTSLGERVRTLGFNPKAFGQSFYYTFAAGKWGFHVSFIPHRDDFELTADVAVRIDEIEDLVNKYDTRRTPAEKRNSMTIGGELGNISQGRPRRWKISDFSDVPIVCGEIMSFFETIGVPFLRAHSEIADVHRVLVSSDQRDIVLAPISGPRYMRAIASAHVLRGTVDLADLIRRSEAKLVQAQDPYLEDFRALCVAVIAGESARPNLQTQRN